MHTFTYPAIFEPGDEGGFVVTFPDCPEVITQGDDQADAYAMAAEALGLVLLHYLLMKRALPAASNPKQGQVAVTVDPELAAKIAVIDAFRASGINKSDLAIRLGKDLREVRRILDPDHATKLSVLASTLAVLGRRLVLGVEAA